MRSLRFIAGLLACTALAACDINVTETDKDAAGSTNNATAAAPPRPPVDPAIAKARADARAELQDLRFLVDISDRKLRLMRGDQPFAEHDVAVGSEEWPTPTGEWRIHRVDLNPEWVPPDESWAEKETKKGPGDPENPMGRARLLYRAPNSIHGTSDLASLGKAESHGSIRVANEVVLQLAEMLLKAGGAWDGAQWFQSMTQNQTREFQIDLEQPVPIVVQE